MPRVVVPLTDQRYSELVALTAHRQAKRVAGAPMPHAETVAAELIGLALDAGRAAHYEEQARAAAQGLDVDALSVLAAARCLI